jgi:hypothetical protein
MITAKIQNQATPRKANLENDVTAYTNGHLRGAHIKRQIKAVIKMICLSPTARLRRRRVSGKAAWFRRSAIY